MGSCLGARVFEAALRLFRRSLATFRSRVSRHPGSFLFHCAADYEAHFSEPSIKTYQQWVANSSTATQRPRDDR